MSDLMEVRDHSQPCEHDFYVLHPGEDWESNCPGGRRIVLRVRKDIVSQRTWGPGDTYLVVGDEQVFGIKRGARVQRFQSDWVEVSDDE